MAKKPSKSKGKGKSSGKPKQLTAAPLPALSFLLATLSDPTTPTYCGRCLYGALVAGTANAEDYAADTPDHFSSSMRKNVDLWKGLYAFLALPRSDEEIDKLLDRLATCQCPFSDLNEEGEEDADIKVYHEIAAIAETNSINRVCIELCAPVEEKPKYTRGRISFVIKVFSVLYSVLSDSGVRSVAKGVVDTWPQSPADLLPFGADDLVQTMMRWFRFIPDPIILLVVSEISHVTRSTIVPSIIKFKFSGVVVDYTKTFVDWILPLLDTVRKDSDDYSAAAGKEKSKVVVQTTSEHGMTSTDDDAALELSTVMRLRYTHTSKAFLSYIGRVMDEFPHESRESVLMPSETKAMQLCSILIYITKHPNSPSDSSTASDNLTAELAKHGRLIYRFFHMHIYPHPARSLPVHPSLVNLDARVFPPPSVVRTPPNSVHFHIGHFHTETRCSAIGCLNSMQSTGRSFQRCAKCQVVSYCGRECQAKAWRDEEVPHKRVCALLCKLIDIAGGPAWLGISVPSRKGLAPAPSPAASLPMYDQMKKMALASGVMNATNLDHTLLMSAVLSKWDKAGIPKEDYATIERWAKLAEYKGEMPYGTLRSEGYGNYEEIIGRFAGKGAKPKYFNVLNKWPSEVAKEKAMLEEQPFWEGEDD